MTTSWTRQLLPLAIAIGVASTASAQSAIDGRWDAVLTIKDASIPFRLDIAGAGAHLVGTLYNGEELETTTSGAEGGGSIELRLDHYLTTITARIHDGALDGQIAGRFEQEQYISSYPFHATRHVDLKNDGTTASSNAPSIGGSWIVPFDSAKGEKAWRFIVRQKGAEVSASILRVDGDTGALTGTYRDDKFLLSHFDGQRPLALEVTSKSDGTLTLLQRGPFSTKGTLTAYREDVARAKRLPAPSNYTTHTTARDTNEVFTFSGPDVGGTVLTNEDPKFKGKVVLAIVTGTWCPNCHDEAQYLVQLDDKYRSRGLEIVALDFEKPEQQDDLARVKAFVKQYGVKYTYLIEGAPAEMWEKVPQLVNLNTWPATVFVGRDGKVKLVHAGFAAQASGEFNDQLKTEFTSTIEALLAEHAPSAVSSTIGH